MATPARIPGRWDHEGCRPVPLCGRLLVPCGSAGVESAIADPAHYDSAEHAGVRVAHAGNDPALPA